MGANMICGSLFPNYNFFVTDTDGCILDESHKGRHVFKSDEGELIEWEWDDDCNCKECQEGDSCAIYEVIPT